MAFRKLFGLLVCVVSLGSCDERMKKTVTIRNNLDFDRKEVVAIKLADLSGDTTHRFTVRSGDDLLISQRIDTNNDSIPDELVFFVDIKANDERTIEILQSDEDAEVKSEVMAYSRFVPERTDDYTWENDLVAFRTYGPEAQRLVEAGEKGGTLSSGMDCWLKRVNYPIIDKWYKKHTEGGSYHQDDGEGYDPYHVGKSRGCGGIGVWKNDSLYVSKNFVSYKAIAKGPVRNVFELTYAPWNVDSISIRETKRITIDLGNQLYKMEDILEASAPVPNYTIGITLHDQKGNVSADSSKGIFSYWETIDDSELGTGIVIDPKQIIEYEDFRTSKKDLSHLYVIAKPERKIEYYTGSAWKKAGVIQTQDEWNAYLEKFRLRLNSPLATTFK